MHSPSVPRYLLGVAFLVLLLSALGFAARRLRRRWLAKTTGPLGALATIMIVLALVVLEAQLLGTCGCFRLGWLALAAFLTAAASWRWCGPAPAAPPVPSTAPVTPAPSTAPVAPVPSTAPVALVTPIPPVAPTRVPLILALLAAGGAFTKWLIPTLQTYSMGPSGFDTLWYHGPQAVEFVQSGYTDRLIVGDPEFFNRFYPATGELLHAVGMVALGYDTLSPAINLLWLVLTLFAAYCAGQHYGLGAWTLLAAAAVTITPMLTMLVAGTFDTDLAAACCLIAGVAIYPRLGPEAGPEDRAARLLLAGLCAGLAISIKPTALVFVAVLSLGTPLICPRGQRRRLTGLWLGGMFAGGYYWYLRDLLAVGTPLPGTLRLFSHGPSALAQDVSYSISHYFGRGAVLSQIVGALGAAIDRYWGWLLGLAVAGALASAIGGVAKRERPLLIFSAAALLAGGAYAFTQNTASAYGGPVFNVFGSTRYLSGPVLLGLILLVVAPPLRGRRLRVLTFLLLAALYIAMALGAGYWSELDRGPAIWTAAILTCGVTTIVLAPSAWRHSLRVAAWRWPALALVLVAAGVGIWFGQRSYLSHRYAYPTGDANVVASAMAPFYAAAQEISGRRIAMAGEYIVRQSYPLYGRALNNTVRYVAWVGADGTIHEYRRCVAWVKALNAGHYNYLVVSPGGLDDHQDRMAAAAHWIHAGPHAQLVIRYVVDLYHFSMWHLTGPLPLSRCLQIPRGQRTVPPIAPVRSTSLNVTPQ